MNTGTLKERSRLLELFRQFRSGREENECEKSNFDALEDKLCNGEGTLDEFERQMLMEAVAKNSEVSDREFRRHKDVLIGKV
jgi:hypothetical protein